MSRARRWTRWALVVPVATALALPVPPAAATTPADALVGGPACAGVTVVVESGTDVQSDCVPTEGPATAAEVLERAGHDLERVQRFPGAVCRVDGRPADAGCVAMPPADAYWGLFERRADRWVFASQGVDTLELDPGDAVAMTWQTTTEPAPPSDASASAPAGTADPAGSGSAGSGSAQGGSAEGGAVPGWLVAVLLAVLAAGTGAALAVRRRTS